MFRESGILFVCKDKGVRGELQVVGVKINVSYSRLIKIRTQNHDLIMGNE